MRLPTNTVRGNLRWRASDPAQSFDSASTAGDRRQLGRVRRRCPREGPTFCRRDRHLRSRHGDPRRPPGGGGAAGARSTHPARIAGARERSVSPDERTSGIARDHLPEADPFGPASSIPTIDMRTPPHAGKSPFDPGFPGARSNPGPASDRNRTRPEPIVERYVDRVEKGVRLRRTAWSDRRGGRRRAIPPKQDSPLDLGGNLPSTSTETASPA